MGLQSSLPTPKIPQEFGGYIEYFPNPHLSIEIINGKWGRPKFHLSFKQGIFGESTAEGELFQHPVRCAPGDSFCEGRDSFIRHIDGDGLFTRSLFFGAFPVSGGFGGLGDLSLSMLPHWLFVAARMMEIGRGHV